jgi:hypothetical protein
MSKTRPKKKKAEEKAKKRAYQPGVLVVSEKHGTSYYWALTQEQKHAQALEILTERFENGWYYCPEPAPTNPELTCAQIEKLPVGETQQAAKKVFHRWKRNWEQTEQARDQYKLMQEAIEKKDGYLAWVLLEERYDNEYEKIRFVRPQGDFKIGTP